MTITICETCNGRGEVPSGHLGLYGPVWRMCPTCDGLGAVEVDPEPEPPAPAGRLVIDGYAVDAPAFTDARQFDAAIGRAFADGLALAPADRPGAVTVRNPRTGRAYRVTRRACTCPAGRRGHGCKHRALAILAADVWHAIPRPISTPAVAITSEVAA